jgi:hypothetical protein
MNASQRIDLLRVFGGQLDQRDARLFKVEWIPLGADQANARSVDNWYSFSWMSPARIP